MSDEHIWRRKCFVVCLLALFLGLIGMILPEQEDIAFEVIVNNTNLAPTQHNYTGTGERVNDVDYYANDSAIEIFLYAHTQTTGEYANIDLFINDTAVMHSDHQGVSEGEVVNTSMSAIIPKGSKYRAVFTSYHHYEWREYPIISGRNGTTSINQTIISNDIAFEIIMNNTNLAPTFHAEIPGTGERVTGADYYANNSAIQIMVFSHATSFSSQARINLSINDTIVSETALRPLSSPENTNTQIIAIIPKYSKYRVNFTNYEHYEWREYPILSGRNGTLSINYTTVQGTSNHSNLTNLLADDHPQYAKTQNATNYYVEITGDDANNCLSIATACKTFQRVWNIIGVRNILSGNVGIYGGNGTFYEYLDIPAVFFNGYNVTMYGQMAQTNLSGATGGSATTYGPSGNFGYAANTSASWTVNAYRNKLLMNPSGQIATIVSNNATRINYTVTSSVFTTFTSGQPIIILDWNTTIECNVQGLPTSLRFGCANLAPNAKLFLKAMKIKNNETTNGQAIFGDFDTQIYARESYIEGVSNSGTVQLTTNSYINTKNSIFVGDGVIIRLEKGSVLYDRNAASIYYLNGTTLSYKTAIFLYIGSQAELNDGFYIDGLTATAGSKGIWAVAGSTVEGLNGCVSNFNYGLYAQRNAIVSELGTVKFNGNTVNYFPTVKIDNSSIQ